MSRPIQILESEATHHQTRYTLGIVLVVLLAVIFFGFQFILSQQTRYENRIDTLEKKLADVEQGTTALKGAFKEDIERLQKEIQRSTMKQEDLERIDNEFLIVKTNIEILDKFSKKVSFALTALEGELRTLKGEALGETPSQ